MMMLMIIVALIVLGLCLGSFVNALVWRLHEQEIETGKKKPNKQYLDSLSISKGRSMCSHCHHELAAKDLIPVVSWLMLRGKCRYCRQPIPDNPLPELLTAALFVLFYQHWPVSMLHGSSTRVFQSGPWQDSAVFILWLAVLVGLVALLVYDLRWMLLPNRIVYPLGVLAAVMVVLEATTADKPLVGLLNSAGAVLVGGGIFYLLFQLSGGKWIGGGDVKLGWVLGALVGTPAKSLLFIFLAAIIGTIVSLPLLLNGKLKRSAVIPFGPFLIIGAVLTVLFGTTIINWYQTSLLGL